MKTGPASTASGTIYTARYMLYSSLALLIAAAAAYWPVLFNPLLSDDLNFRILFRGDALDWSRVAQEFSSGWGGLVGADYYRPLLTCSVVADYWFWGDNPFGYHLTNLLFHTLNALLVAHIAVRLAGPGKRYPALLGAFVFVLHPLHPEAVAWVAGRVDVLSAFFFLFTVRTYLAYRWTGRRRHLLLSLLALTLGLGAKESMAVAPFVLLALDVGLKLSHGWPHWAYGIRPAVLLHFGLLGGYFALRQLVIGSLAGSQNLFAPYASLDALLHTVKQTGIKLFLLLAPANEAALGPTRTLVFQIVVLVVMLLPFAALLTHGRRTMPGPLVGLALIFFPLALVGHIDVDPLTLTNSRVLYLPTAGFILLLYSGPWDPGVRHELRRLGAAQTAVLSLLLGAAFFAVLRVNLGPWREAGQVMTALVRETDRVNDTTPARQKILLVHLPDQVKGAYVARNGFLFSLLRPFHTNDIRRVYPVHDYFYARDPGMLRAAAGDLTRIVIWNDETRRLQDVPAVAPAPHTLTDRDLGNWSDLGSRWWTPEPGLARRVLPGGAVELTADNEGAGLLGPVMRISPDALHALRFHQDGRAGFAIGWSTAADPDVFPSSPVMFFPARSGERTVALINHATWFLPHAPPVGRLRISVRPAGTPLVLSDFALLRKLPRLPLAVAQEPLHPTAGAAFPLPMLRCNYRHYKISLLNPAAPHAVRVERAPADDRPLLIPARELAHLHMVARAIGGFEALLYVDAVEADGAVLTTLARSRLVRIQFDGE